MDNKVTISRDGTKIGTPTHYIGTKELLAWPLTRGEYNTYRGWCIPPGEDPNEPGYMVEYLDGGKANVAGHGGYVSWSPADVFQRTYRPISEHEMSEAGASVTGFDFAEVQASVTDFDFGNALRALGHGLKVARTGWNGKGMFIYLVPPGAYPARTGAAKSHYGEDALVPYRAYIAMKTAQNDVVPWVASQSDLLADDWQIVDSELAAYGHAYGELPGDGDQAINSHHGHFDAGDEELEGN